MNTVQALAETGGKYEDVMRHCSRVFLRAALKAHGGCQAATALAIGVHRNTLYRYMREAGIPTRLQPKLRRKPVGRVGAAEAVELVDVRVGTTAVRAHAVAMAVQPANVAGVHQLSAQGAGVAEFFVGGQSPSRHAQAYRTPSKGTVAA